MAKLTLEQQIAGGKAAAEQKKAEKAELLRLRAYVASLPLPKPAPEPAELTEQYKSERLARVKAQLDRIDAMMLTEEEPQKIDRLASAQARLAEQERLLSGRPLPGSLKPSSPSRRQQTRIEPLPDEPSSPATTTPKQ